MTPKHALTTILFAAALATAPALWAAETCSSSPATGRSQGELPSCVAIDGATIDTTSATINTFGYRFLSAQIYSTGASTTTVNIECRSRSSATAPPTTVAPWTVCRTAVVNPDAAGIYVTLARAFQYQIRMSGTSAGTTTVIVERYND